MKKILTTFWGNIDATDKHCHNCKFLTYIADYKEKKGRWKCVLFGGKMKMDCVKNGNKGNFYAADLKRCAACIASEISSWF